MDVRQTGMADVTELERQLNDFDPAVREAALRRLVSMAHDGSVPLAPQNEVANMHCHTFFSFNAYGHSPSSLVWLARRLGLKLIGIVDFDVLDGVDEFLSACDLAGVRGSAGIETRIFVPEYAFHEINSPGEPGVAYHMGIGFSSGLVPASVEGILADLRQRAAQRNEAILSRLNAYLAPVEVDYAQNVMPLTPAGNPTERHLVLAYLQAAQRATKDPVIFWADRLGVAPEQVAPLMPDSPDLQNLIRSKLMKQGGVGYIQPESGMFPTLEAFHTLIATCGALPCAAWLDGTSTVEQDPEAWLAFMLGKGVLALNIIPDRNWNVADPAARQLRVRNLYHVVDVASDLNLPLNVGTEMNSFGQKPVDQFSAPELAPVRGLFLDGAYLIYGHTMLQRALGWGYPSPWAEIYLPARRERNSFYTQVGRLAAPGLGSLARLRRLDPAAVPTDVLAVLGE